MSGFQLDKCGISGELRLTKPEGAEKQSPRTEQKIQKLDETKNEEDSRRTEKIQEETDELTN